MNIISQLTTFLLALGLCATALHPSARAESSQAPTSLQGTRTLIGYVLYPNKKYKRFFATGPSNGVNGASATGETPFRAASISKTFTAAATFKLIEQGQFALEQTIDTLLSDATLVQFEQAQIDASAITIRQLLSQRSGLANYASTEVFQSALMANPKRQWRRAEQLAIALELGAAPAGSVYQYGDTNYILLGEIIEQSTGKSLGESVRQLLNFQALGLSQTYWELSERAPANSPPLLRSFVQGLDIAQLDASFDGYGGGGLVSNARDLVNFYRALFAGQIISAQSLAIMTTSQSGGGFGEFAYSAGLMPFYLGNQECFGHEGFGSVVVGHCPRIDFSFAFAAGSDQIPGIGLVHQGIGYELANALNIDTQAKPFGREFQRTRCPPELASSVATTQCGMFTVEQSRGQFDSRKIRFPVLIAKSAASNVANNAEPLLLLGGGPGDSLFATLPGLIGNPESYAALIAKQDLVAIEYRGVGAATPNLQCDARITSPETIQLCLTKMRDLGIDLSRYNSAEFAKDIELLRRSMGVRRWNVLGFSFGTRAAITLFRDFPQSVKSLVLDGVTTPDEAFADPEQAAIALHQYLQSCATELACNAAFPNLKNRFVAELNRLNQQPLLIDGRLIDGDGLVRSLTVFQASPDLLRYLPAVMDRFANGDSAFVGALLGGPDPGAFLPPDPDFSDALFFSTVCNESVPFANKARYQAIAAGNDPIQRAYAKVALETIATCAQWPSGRGADRERLSVALNVPTAVLISQFDLQTPAQFGRKLVANNPVTAKAFEFPVGHIALQQQPECALPIVISFLTNPLTPVGNACAATKPSWALEIDPAFFEIIGN